MIKLFKSMLHAFLLKKHRAIVPTTDFALLERFFSMIKPVPIDTPLIRLGSEGDGGYLIPDDLNDIKTCFSPGVSTIADFELSLANRGIECFLTDYSVQNSPVEHPLIHFQKKYVGSVNDEIYITLDKWCNDSRLDNNDSILQMDIEGAEYEVIFDASEETLKNFRIIIIEFHHLERLINAQTFNFLNLIFKKLHKYFDVVHIHPNNCEKPYIYGSFEIPPIMEFTFLRRDRVHKNSAQLTYPHLLDRKNISTIEDVILPKCWFKSF